VDEQTGYVVGGYPVVILKTTNGGANWVSQSSGTNKNLRSVHFPVDAQTGYAVGDSGIILKTTNGGTNWASQTSGTTSWFYSVHFPVDVQTGYAVGGGGGVNTILKTTNGGANWVSQSSGAFLPLFSVHFPVDATTGYAVGYRGTILKTTDGGIGVEENTEVRGQRLEVRLTAKPNPFTSFATVPGHSSERFTLYDISGRRVGVYRGDRIGEGLRAGVYFLMAEGKEGKPVRVVKVR
jgi:photosystem II stability/assembly factor-like uncharacterized protein